MKQIIFYPLLFIAILFASCSKDSSSNTNPVILTPKLKRVTYTTVGTRIADILEVEYDANNRVTILYSRHEDSSFTPIKIVNKSTNYYFYNGSSNYPYKDSIYDVDILGNGRSYINNFTYNAQNNLLKEESIAIIKEYEYNSNWMIKKRYDFFTGTYNLNSIDSFQFDTNGKIITSRTHHVSSSIDTFSYTYDNKLNPFATLNISKIPTYYSGVISFDESLRSLNNVLTYTGKYGNPTSLIENEILTYVYDTNGYPINGTSSRSNIPGTSNNYNIKFEYY